MLSIIQKVGITVTYHFSFHSVIPFFLHFTSPVGQMLCSFRIPRDSWPRDLADFRRYDQFSGLCSYKFFSFAHHRWLVYRGRLWRRCGVCVCSYSGFGSYFDISYNSGCGLRLRCAPAQSVFLTHQDLTKVMFSLHKIDSARRFILLRVYAHVAKYLNKADRTSKHQWPPIYSAIVFLSSIAGILVYSLPVDPDSASALRSPPRSPLLTTRLLFW
jgi:hypothetical protein